MQYFRIRNSERFQHYKNRNPPWVKLHRAFLTDPDLCCLQDASRLLACCLTLIVAKHGNRLPWSPEWVQHEAHLHSLPDLDALLSAGFIERCEAASNPLAECLQDACLREESTEYREVPKSKSVELAAANGNGNGHHEPEPVPGEAAVALAVIPLARAGLAARRAPAMTTIVRSTDARSKRDSYHAALVGFAFGYWAARLGHMAARLDPKRERTVLARLQECDGNPNDLLYAIDGALRDDWTMGRDRRSVKRFDGIETIFRDRGKVEELAGLIPEWARGVPHPKLSEIPALEESA